jgi:DNA (cytosine-5)-methyltransferase 1
MSLITVGSVCSGIEAASVAFRGLGMRFSWFSEIASFPSKLLSLRYPQVPNLGDMCGLPDKIASGALEAPDLICGGTPCQAFSLAGWKKGLEDYRGNLTLRFVDVIEENDRVRRASGLSKTIVLWENVEGVLRDKTNAFGCFISSLAGLDEEIAGQRWPSAGLLRGPIRNVAWRVLDAKHFGLPQQRRRVYVIAGGKDFFPETVLFERGIPPEEFFFELPALQFEKNGVRFEVFREYTDCLYSAYGTKWNGNAAAYNGSLFILQERRLRRFTPLECERLMGFPDGYSEIANCKPTSRYQALGNSWAVPVVRWIGERLISCSSGQPEGPLSLEQVELNSLGYEYIDLGRGSRKLVTGAQIWAADRPIVGRPSRLQDIVDTDVDERFFITPAGCKGILRRSEERHLQINPRLERALRDISSAWSDERIEQISRRQKRGRFSTPSGKPDQTISLFE